jgi:TRAP-type mannitol/chloroaromatic compound transport system permease small subunit
MEKIFNVINLMSEWTGRAVSWLFLALILSVCIDLFSRFFTGKSTDWAFDINYMLYGTNFMIAGAYTLKHNAHVRVDVLYMRFSPRTRAALECIFYLLIMFPLCTFMLHATWLDFINAVKMKEVSIVSSWHPPVYHYKAIMPLTFALLILQSVTMFIPNLVLAVKGGPDDDK